MKEVPEDVYDILKQHGVEIINEKQRRRVTKLIKNLCEDTRLIINRGHKQKELKGLRRREANIVEFKKIKERKIYPNDLCPCGSGRKFKDCCGRKRKS